MRVWQLQYNNWRLSPTRSPCNRCDNIHIPIKFFGAHFWITLSGSGSDGEDS
jgi:hypothetical protein